VSPAVPAGPGPGGRGEPANTTLPQDGRRAVITGIGIVAPGGIGTDAWWKNALEGNSAIRRITLFDPSKYPAQLAGEVDGFNAEDWIERRMIVQTDRWTHMALAATQMAFEDAKFDPLEADEWSMSAITASSSGGNQFGQKEIQNLWGKGPVHVGAYQSIAWFYAATTGQISIRHNMKGPCGVVLSEGAGGLEALQQSRRTIRRGFHHIVSGGLEAPIGPYALACQLGTGMLSEATEPEDAYRPFDARANGYVPGEGGAILLVEELEAARERGAPQIYGEITGYGATFDAHHWGRPAPDGKQYARAMRLALQQAGVEPGDVDAVFADASGVAEHDAIEAAAIDAVFNGAKVPVTAPKSMTGRLYAGGASLDVAAALLAMRDGQLPPTVNFDEAAEGCAGLDVVTGSAREVDVGTVLVAARGYGGFNAALVLRREV
jgi:3-oxoacyl-(acyl-carrier-protein) synthase